MADQSFLLDQIKDALRANRSVAVRDLAKLLKPKGISELEQVGAKLRKDEINVYFVTVPAGPNLQGLTAAVYRELGMGDKDLLILFNGKQVHARSVALQGQESAFQEAIRDALPLFKLYYAKGLAHLAEGLRDRIVANRAADKAAATRQQEQARAQAAAVERQQAVQTRNAYRNRLIVFVTPLAIAGGAMTWVIGRRMKNTAEGRRSYRDGVAEAEAVYQRIALKLPRDATSGMRDEFLRFDQELQDFRNRDGMNGDALKPLTRRLEEFERRLPEWPVSQAVAEAARQQEPPPAAR